MLIAKGRGCESAYGRCLLIAPVAVACLAVLRALAR